MINYYFKTISELPKQFDKIIHVVLMVLVQHKALDMGNVCASFTLFIFMIHFGKVNAHLSIMFT